MSQEPDIDRRWKIQALALAKECYTTKLELLTNATVADDAIRFVAEHSNSNSNCNKKNWQHTKSSNDDKEKVVNYELNRTRNRRINAYG